MVSECGCFGKFKCNAHCRDTGPVQVVKCNHMWPMVSDAVAVMPNQIQEAAEAARKHGVPTDFTPKGQPIFTSPRHRRDYCERVRGVVDRNAGYSDPQKVRA